MAKMRTDHCRGRHRLRDRSAKAVVSAIRPANSREVKHLGAERDSFSRSPSLWPVIVARSIAHCIIGDAHGVDFSEEDEVEADDDDFERLNE
jgi:hypothetical protein